jgi:hypothetical protein
MNVLIGCEESQVVMKAFREKGHNAYSCDIQECSGGMPEYHFNTDIFKVIECGELTTQSGNKVFIDKWDMAIFHPPCTFLSYAGNGWFNVEKYGQKAIDRFLKRDDAMNFFMKLWECRIDKICIENPRGYPMKFIPYSQMIHPYYFGDNDKKLTCLWLKNLDKLIWAKQDNLFGKKTASLEPKPLFIDKSGKKRYFTDAKFGYNENTKKLRSKTFQGIANAMAKQWG